MGNTPECAKEIECYLDFRARRGEKITSDSFLIVKQFGVKNDDFTGESFNFKSLRSVLEDHIFASGMREIDHKNPHKGNKFLSFMGLENSLQNNL